MNEKLLTVCLERLDAAPGETVFTRCVALPAAMLGLGLGRGGEITWNRADHVACDLWVSETGDLVLTRCDGEPPVQLVRSGRTLDVASGRGVSILTGDEIAGPSGARFRIHLHGLAQAPAPPEPLDVGAPDEVPAEVGAKPRWWGAAAAALAGVGALGALAWPSGAEASKPKDVPVRIKPPKPMPNPDYDRFPPSRRDAGPSDAAPADAAPSDVGPAPGPEKPKAP